MLVHLIWSKYTKRHLLNISSMCGLLYFLVFVGPLNMYHIVFINYVKSASVLHTVHIVIVISNIYSILTARSTYQIAVHLLYNEIVNIIQKLIFRFFLQELSKEISWSLRKF